MTTDAVLGAGVALVMDTAVWIPVHVVDARPRRDLGLLRGGAPLSKSQEIELDAASAERARAIVDATQVKLRERGLAFEPAGIRTGEPGREICGAATSLGADLIVLSASRHERPRPGPGSLGHTARFVVDHAPCPVLLIR